jgi:hypothetical protein
LNYEFSIIPVNRRVALMGVENLGSKALFGSILLIAKPHELTLLLLFWKRRHRTIITVL